MTSEKEKSAIDLFVRKFNGSYQKLGAPDVGYKIFDSNGNHIAYGEIIDRPRTMHDAYLLPVTAKKLVRLMDKRITSVCIWACNDGIIYGQIDKMKGEIKWGNDPHMPSELIVYYDKQSCLKYIRFSSNSF